MFDLITTSLPGLISELSTAASDLSTSFGNITTAASSLVDVSSITAPTFSNALGSISPSLNLYSISMPSMGGFSPLDIIKITDGCHLESVGGGDILLAIQNAVSSVVDGILDSLKEQLQKASQMFVNIVPQIKEILTWLKNELDSLWESIKTSYIEWFGNKEDLKIQIESMMESGVGDVDSAQMKEMLNKKSLWERAVSWFEKLLKETICPMIATLKTSVEDFVEILKNIREKVLPKLDKCTEDFGKLPGDVACLMKAASSVFA
jgi:hypothetical protein